MRVRELLNDLPPRNIITVQSDRSIHETTRIMSLHKVGALPVICQTSGLVGLVSERDIVHAIASSGGAALQKLVHEIMTRSLYVCAPGDNVFDVTELMNNKKIRHIPVVENNMLLDMLSIQDFENAVVSLREQTLTDDLTGLHNNNHFSALLENEFNRYRRFESPLCVAMAEIDKFDQIASAHETLAVDELIKSVADVLRHQTRAYDTIGRIEKGKFAIALPNTELRTAIRACQRIQQSVKSPDFGIEAIGTVSVSLGVVAGTRTSKNGRSILKEASQLLAMAIEQGGDQIESVNQDPDELDSVVNS